MLRKVKGFLFNGNNEFKIFNFLKKPIYYFLLIIVIFIVKIFSVNKTKKNYGKF